MRNAKYRVCFKRGKSATLKKLFGENEYTDAVECFDVKKAGVSDAVVLEKLENKKWVGIDIWNAR